MVIEMTKLPKRMMKGSGPTENNMLIIVFLASAWYIVAVVIIAYIECPSFANTALRRLPIRPFPAKGGQA